MTGIRFTIAFLSLQVVVVGGHAVCSCSAIASDAGASSHEEANLRGITFIDPDRGWAAGDRGTILHTEDRGISWKRQATETTASLADIGMYNSKRGLAIGGYYQGYTQLSIGEVVVTADGGLSWRLISGHDLPRLRQLIIGPGGKCVAVGDWSPVHLTSVFVSENGGQTWSPQPCQMVGPAVSVAGSVDDYLVLTDRGEVVRFRSDFNPQPLFPPNDEWRVLAGNENRRMLIGPRGMIESQDQGETWQANSQPLNVAPAFASASIEPGETGAAVIWKDEIWAASDANSSIATLSPSSAEAVPHQGQASIRRIIRLDSDRGWAVGDFGLILTTRDAGKSWRTLRGGNLLPAVMVVGAEPVSLPWTLLAIESLQHHRRVSLVVDRRDGKVTCPQRDGIVDASASLGPSSLFIASSNRSRIAEILQISKPAVVVLDQTLQPDQRAAWSAAALESGVQRVLEVGERGAQTIHVASAIPSAGILASDVWYDAISILSPEYLPPAKVMLSARLDATNDRLAGEGLATCVGTDTRYRWSKETTNSRRQLQVLQARTTELNWVESLVANSKSPEEFKSLLDSVLPRIIDSDRQRVFARLIALTGKHTRYDLHVAAIETYVDDSDKRPGIASQSTDDLLGLARLRLKAIRGSSEWRQTFGNAAIALPSSIIAGSTASAQTPINLAVQLSPFQTQATPLQGINSEVQRAGGFGKSNEPRAQNVSLASGTTESLPASEANYPSKVDLRWEFHPAVLMVSRANEWNQRIQEAPLRTLDGLPVEEALPIQNAESKSEDTGNVATTNLRRLAENSASGRWGLLAANGQLPATNFCVFTQSRPTLDGLCDEPWWGAGQPIQNDTNFGTVRLAHDDNFFYVAIDAAPMNAATHSAKIRQRDTPLDSSDRYRLRLDIDRDLMTSYEFEFDAAGNTRDSCDGFPQFQPRWFIACTQTNGRTMAEMAIQKSDISPDAGLHGTIWNLSIERMTNETPGRGLAVPNPDDWQPVWLE